MAMKTNFPTINLWTTQSNLCYHKTWGGVWAVIAISSFSYLGNDLKEAACTYKVWRTYSRNDHRICLPRCFKEDFKAVDT